MYHRAEIGTFEKDGSKYHIRLIASIYELDPNDAEKIYSCKEYPITNRYYGNEPHIRCEQIDDQGRILKFFEITGEMPLKNKSNIELFKEQKVTYLSDFEEKDIFRAIEVSFNSFHDGFKLHRDIHLALVSKLLFQPYDEYAREFPEKGAFYCEKITSIFNDRGVPHDLDHKASRVCRQSDYKFIIDTERVREEHGHNNETRYEFLPSPSRMATLDTHLSGIAFKNIFRKNETKDLSLDF